MPPSMTAGSSSVALAQFFTDDIGLRQEPNGSALPGIPIIRFRWGDGFAASLVRCFAAFPKWREPPLPAWAVDAGSASVKSCQAKFVCLLQRRHPLLSIFTKCLE